MQPVKAPNVTIIAPTRNLRSIPLEQLPKKLRVAAYARVSTNDADQENSFKTQVEYYTRYIQSNPDWQFVKIYADKGLSGVSAKNRVEFLQMIEDAKEGKIDLILCKATSRFSRNTLEALKYARELKSYGTNVLFQEQGVDTRQQGFELTFTIYSSLGQFEVESTSSNIRWTQLINRQAGKVCIPYSHFLGYRKGADDQLEIDPEEAKTIKLIYELYLSGLTYSEIAHKLEEKHLLSPVGKERWYPSTVKSILSNEKYKGDAVLAKTYTRDVLDKERHVNHGEMPQYYVTDSHPAIIDRETHELVQDRMNKATSKKKSSLAFASKLYCADCGGMLRHKVWNCRGKIKYDMWVCSSKINKDKMNKESKCKLPNIRQDIIESAYLSAVAQILPSEAEISRNNAKLIAFGSDPNREKKYNKKLTELEKRCEESSKRIEAFVKNNMSHSSSGEDYGDVLMRLSQEDNDAIKAYEDYKSSYQEKLLAYTKVNMLISALRKQAKSPTTFIREVFIDIVEKAVIGKDYINFFFVDGKKIKIKI